MRGERRSLTSHHLSPGGRAHAAPETPCARRTRRSCRARFQNETVGARLSKAAIETAWPPCRPWSPGRPCREPLEPPSGRNRWHRGQNRSLHGQIADNSRPLRPSRLPQESPEKRPSAADHAGRELSGLPLCTDKRFPMQCAERRRSGGSRRRARFKTARDTPRRKRPSGLSSSSRISSQGDRSEGHRRRPPAGWKSRPSSSGLGRRSRPCQAVWIAQSLRPETPAKCARPAPPPPINEESGSMPLREL